MTKLMLMTFQNDTESDTQVKLRSWQRFGEGGSSSSAATAPWPAVLGSRKRDGLSYPQVAPLLSAAYAGWERLAKHPRCTTVHSQAEPTPRCLFSASSWSPPALWRNTHTLLQFDSDLHISKLYLSEQKHIPQTTQDPLNTFRVTVQNISDFSSHPLHRVILSFLVPRIFGFSAKTHPLLGQLLHLLLQFVQDVKVRLVFFSILLEFNDTFIRVLLPNHTEMCQSQISLKPG